MSVIIKTSEMQYRDQLGNYHGINAIAEKKIADQVADLDAAISSAQTAVDGIDAQRQTMIAAIASVAGQGTDTTLTQSGVAADAKSAGDEIRNVKSALDNTKDLEKMFYSIKLSDFSSVNTDTWADPDTGAIQSKAGYSSTSRLTYSENMMLAIGDIETMVLYYSTNTESSQSSFIGRTEWLTNTYVIINLEEYPYYIVCQKTADASVFKANATRYRKGYINEEKIKTVSKMVNLEPEIELPIGTLLPGYIKATDGAVAESTSGLTHTRIIDIEGYHSIRYSRRRSTSTSNTTVGMAFYDESRSYITGYKDLINGEVEQYEDYTITVPENARYARFSAKESLGTFYAYGISKLMRFTDKTLSVENAPADAKATGDEVIKALKNTVDLKKTFYSIRFGTVSIGASNSWANPETGAFENKTGYSRTARLTSSENLLLEIGNIETMVLYYTTNTGEITDAFTGQTTGWLRNTYVIINVEEYPYYVICQKTTDSDDFINNTCRYRKGYINEEKIKTVSKIVDLKPEIELSTGTLLSGYVDATSGNISVSTSGLKYTKLIDVEGYHSIRYSRRRKTSTASDHVGMAFYDENKSYVYGYRDLINGEVDAYEDYTIIVPSNARYARFSVKEELGTFYAYGISKLYQNGSNIGYIQKEALAMGLHTIPSSIGMLNVIRRARQLTDVKWTPVANMKRVGLYSKRGNFAGESQAASSDDRHYEDVFLSGHEYSGIPYTEVYHAEYEHNMTLGNLDAMVSAMESAGTNAYATYQFDPASSHGSKMGGTCVDLVMYAYELPRGHLNTWSTRYMTSAGQIPLYDSTTDEYLDPENIHQGDALHHPDHIVLVTDVIRDINGNITAFEISEDTTGGNLTDQLGTNYGGKCRRWVWGVDDFFFKNFKNYSVFRFKEKFVNRVTYTPLDCVQVGSECRRNFDGPKPIITENGDKSILARGTDNTLSTTVKLIVESEKPIPGGSIVYNKIAVKDPDGTITKYDISGDTLTVNMTKSGMWSANLQYIDGSNVIQYISESTRWLVIMLTDMSYTFDGSGGVTLTVSHPDIEGCELVGFTTDSNGGLVLEAISNCYRTSTVDDNNIRTWTVTGNGLGSASTIRHIVFRTPFGLAKCLSDRTY